MDKNMNNFDMPVTSSFHQNMPQANIACPGLGEFPCEPCISRAGITALDDLPLGMAYIPFQKWGKFMKLHTL